jgi:hypothetical protein
MPRGSQVKSRNSDGVPSSNSTFEFELGIRDRGGTEEPEFASFHRPGSAPPQHTTHSRKSCDDTSGVDFAALPTRHLPTGLVVDPGIHAMGWTREAAMAWVSSKQVGYVGRPT